MSLTLDEAIKHCHDKAEEIRKANEEMPTECKLSEDLCECANEHEQLAAWLTELKELREKVEKKELETYQRGYKKGLKAGNRSGARKERKEIIAYLEGKTKEEDEIEQMIKNGEFEPIPYLGETAEEEPNV